MEIAFNICDAHPPTPQIKTWSGVYFGFSFPIVNHLL